MGQNGPKSGENLRFLLKFGQKLTKIRPKSGENVSNFM